MQAKNVWIRKKVIKYKVWVVNPYLFGELKRAGSENEHNHNFSFLPLIMSLTVT